MIERKILAERLRMLREEKGLEQKEIAKLLNITPAAYGTYERGEREPSLQTLKRLSEIFGVSIDYLLGKTPYRNEKTVDEMLKDLNLAPAYFKLSKRAQEEGIDPEDLEVLINFLSKVGKKKKDTKEGR